MHALLRHARFASLLALALLIGVIPAIAQPQSVADDQPAALSVDSAQPTFAIGEPVAVEGTVTDASDAPVASRVEAVLEAPDGSVIAGPVEVVAGGDGVYSVAFPGDATAGVVIDPRTGYEVVLAVRLSAQAADGSADATGEAVGVQAVRLQAPPATLTLENSFVSSLGWVKPAENYLSRLIVANRTGAAQAGAVVEAPASDGMRFISAQPIGSGGDATVNDDGSLTWDVGTIEAGSVDEPTFAVLIVESVADTLAQDPELVWKDLSTTATLRGPGIQATATARGPKVIPPNATYETARYGDRPYPVVPVDFYDREHLDSNSGTELDQILNDPSEAGSTFNLFQEMSYGQLFPNGAVPANGIATATWDGVEPGDFHERQEPALNDSTSDTPPDYVPNPCDGTYQPEIADGDGERIIDGFYQLPGSTEFYGSDSGIYGDETRRPDNGGQIDSGCGNISKVVYDAAAAADPEIDYNDFDTDKDGVVDFFMMVFAGCGGNGPSQRDCYDRNSDGDLVPTDYSTGSAYDAIWPHSSSLEAGFFDAATGLTGYVTDDQLTNLAGEPLYYTTADRVATSTGVTDFPAMVRVGPYNVNPEDSLDFASVISHEYGHSLGLPDYYGLGQSAYYGSWNLMASDYSQQMDINARQELGWVIPQEIPEGTSELSLVDHTVDTNVIAWQTPQGEPYVLSGPDVHNGDAYVASLPRRVLFSEDLLGTDTDPEGPGASPSHVWWSQSGDDFGCVPAPSAHSLDIPLTTLADVAPGTGVTLSFDSYFDIEWEFDYGFVLATTDGGGNYASLSNDQGYTIADDNPFGVACQEKFGNGLTGSSGSYEDGGDPDGDRAGGVQTPGTTFLPMTFDLTDYVGEDTTLRFAYNTDVGLSRPGWFIDDVRVVTDDGDVLYESNFEGADSLAGDDVVNGGCTPEGIETGPCSDGWQYIAGGQESVSDHAYYFEARDRSGFDFDSRGQADRGELDWTPGVSLAYTDEARGYGNTTAPFRPNQTVLDSTPVPLFSGPVVDSLLPDLGDAAWTEDDVPFSDSGAGHEDNYAEFLDDGTPVPWALALDCLDLEVTGTGGLDIGPSIPPGNLTADVQVTRNSGCGSRDYGFGNTINGAPTAVPQARDDNPMVDVEVDFDGSASFDDVTPASALDYTWDFDGDGEIDATGDQATYSFGAVGQYEATLMVTDSGGLSGTDSIPITVRPGPLPPVEPPPPEADLNIVDRISGDNRIATAIQVSRSAFDMAESAVIVRADDYPDALAAATLAAEVGGPVLLTNSGDLDLRVVAELGRLGVSAVYLAGGETALSDAIDDALARLGVTVVRVGGAERNETAANIARQVVELGGSIEGAVVVRNDDFADALGAGNLATYSRTPILLTSSDELPAPTAEVLAELLPTGTVDVVGGTAVVSEVVASALSDGGNEVNRIAGPERIATSVAVVNEAMSRGAGAEPALVANGFNYPDALAAAPAAYERGGVLLLTNPEGLANGPALGVFLTANNEEIDTAFIIGGTAAVVDTVDSEVLTAIRAEGER